MKETFTIVSTGGPLVEVTGRGPTLDLAGGLAVPDGVPTIGPVNLLEGFTRVWRVDGPPTVKAKIEVSDSPFGALLSVRRCVEEEEPHHNGKTFPAVPPADVMASLKGLGEQLWNAPVREALHAVFQLAPVFLAALLADLVDPMPASCEWRDVVEKSSEPVTARGGDLVVVTFVVP
jgi:hypothetical protein